MLIFFSPLTINSLVGSRALSSPISTCMPVGAAPQKPIPPETRENIVMCQLLTCGQIDFLQKGVVNLISSKRGFPVRISTGVPATMQVQGRAPVNACQYAGIQYVQPCWQGSGGSSPVRLRHHCQGMIASTHQPGARRSGSGSGQFDHLISAK